MRTQGRKRAANLTATISILSLGITGVASLVLWGTTAATSSTSTSSSSTSSTAASDDGGTSDDGATSAVTQSSGTASIAQSTGS